MISEILFSFFYMCDDKAGGGGEIKCNSSRLYCHAVAIIASSHNQQAAAIRNACWSACWGRHGGAMFVGWLIGWLLGRFVGWHGSAMLVGWLIGPLACWIIRRLIGQHSGVMLIGLLFGQHSGAMLISWLFGRHGGAMLIKWLVGRLLVPAYLVRLLGGTASCTVVQCLFVGHSSMDMAWLDRDGLKMMASTSLCYLTYFFIFTAYFTGVK